MAVKLQPYQQHMLRMLDNVKVARVVSRCVGKAVRAQQGCPDVCPNPRLCAVVGCMHRQPK